MGAHSPSALPGTPPLLRTAPEPRGFRSGWTLLARGSVGEARSSPTPPRVGVREMRRARPGKGVCGLGVPCLSS